MGNTSVNPAGLAILGGLDESQASGYSSGGGSSMMTDSSGSGARWFSAPNMHLPPSPGSSVQNRNVTFPLNAAQQRDRDQFGGSFHPSQYSGYHPPYSGGSTGASSSLPSSFVNSPNATVNISKETNTTINIGIEEGTMVVSAAEVSQPSFNLPRNMQSTPVRPGGPNAVQFHTAPGPSCYNISNTTPPSGLFEQFSPPSFNFPSSGVSGVCDTTPPSFNRLPDDTYYNKGFQKTAICGGGAASTPYSGGSTLDRMAGASGYNIGDFTPPSGMSTPGRSNISAVTPPSGMSGAAFSSMADRSGANISPCSPPSGMSGGAFASMADRSGANISSCSPPSAVSGFNSMAGRTGFNIADFTPPSGMSDSICAQKIPNISDTSAPTFNVTRSTLSEMAGRSGANISSTTPPSFYGDASHEGTFNRVAFNAPDLSRVSPTRPCGAEMGTPWALNSTGSTIPSFGGVTTSSPIGGANRTFTATPGSPPAGANRTYTATPAGGNTVLSDKILQALDQVSQEESMIIRDRLRNYQESRRGNSSSCSAPCASP